MSVPGTGAIAMADVKHIPIALHSALTAAVRLAAVAHDHLSRLGGDHFDHGLVHHPPGEWP
jgi:hypothetical protein